MGSYEKQQSSTTYGKGSTNFVGAHNGDKERLPNDIKNGPEKARSIKKYNWTKGVEFGNSTEIVIPMRTVWSYGNQTFVGPEFYTEWQETEDSMGSGIYSWFYNTSFKLH